jgi:hypothetical protein
MTAPGAPMPPGPQQQPNNTLGLTSMILGIVSIPLCICFGLGGLVGAAAAVLGHLGKQKADQGLATNRGQAMTGFICGLIGAGLGVLYLILAVIGNVIDVGRLPG